MVAGEELDLSVLGDALELEAALLVGPGLLHRVAVAGRVLEDLHLEAPAAARSGHQENDLGVREGLAGVGGGDLAGEGQALAEIDDDWPLLGVRGPDGDAVNARRRVAVGGDDDGQAGAADEVLDGEQALIRAAVLAAAGEVTGEAAAGLAGQPAAAGEAELDVKLLHWLASVRVNDLPHDHAGRVHDDQALLAVELEGEVANR